MPVYKVKILNKEINLNYEEVHKERLIEAINQIKYKIKSIDNLNGKISDTQLLTFLSIKLQDKIFELALDSGANECFSNEYFHEIQCDKNEIYNVKKKLEKSIRNFLSTEIEWIPLNKIEVSSVEKEEIINFLGILDYDDDVQNVYANVKF